MNIDPEPFAIGALLLALIGLGVAYVRKEHKSTMLANIGIAAAGMVCLVLLALKVYGQEDEVANLALYLCSDEAGFITGTDFPIDGGFIKLNG